MTNPATSGVELPDMDLLRKFDVPAPRYTSYPTADRFHTEFGVEDYEKALASRADASILPRSRSMCMSLSVTTSVTTVDATRSLLAITLGALNTLTCWVKKRRW